MNNKEIKTDPKLRFSILKRSEEDILQKLAETEKQLKILLAQLTATRNLLGETEQEIEDNSYERTTTQLKKEKEEVDALEEVVAESQEAIRKSNKKEEFSTYTSITGQHLTTATSYDSIKRLTELAYTHNEWSEEESKQFFQIRDAIHRVQGYNLSEPLQETIEQAYQAVQLVEERKPEQIALNYDSQYAMNRPNEIQNKPLNLDQTIQNLTPQYKPQPELKPLKEFDVKEYKPIDKRIDLKKKKSNL